jgi:hypothetical protein
MKTSCRLLVIALLGSVAAAAATPKETCDPRGLRPLLVAGNVLLLGEVHGGVEGPALLTAAACAAARAGLPVTLALEVPLEEGARIERFLSSPGLQSDRQALLAGPFWTREYQDGRSSTAMLRLLDALRELRHELRHELRNEGGRIRVVLLDSARPLQSGQQRDDFMAQRLVAAVEAAGGAEVVLAYAGNIHTRTSPGVPWDAAYRPAGVAVEQRWPDRTVSLRLTAPPGEAWMCSSAEATSCAVTSLGGKPVDAPGSVELYGETREGYEGEVRLGAATAAPPAAGLQRAPLLPPS